MKRFYLLVLAFFIASATVTPAYQTNLNGDDKPRPTTEEIEIRDLQMPTIARPRTVTPFVNSYYSADMNMLEIYFNYEIGTVKISVLDGMQRCVAQYTCDTEAEGEVFLNLVLFPDDTYTIHIKGADYEGIGEFIP